MSYDSEATIAELAYKAAMKQQIVCHYCGEYHSHEKCYFYLSKIHNYFENNRSILNELYLRINDLEAIVAALAPRVQRSAAVVDQLFCHFCEVYPANEECSYFNNFSDENQNYFYNENNFSFSKENNFSFKNDFSESPSCDDVNYSWWQGHPDSFLCENEHSYNHDSHSSTFPQIVSSSDPDIISHDYFQDQEELDFHTIMETPSEVEIENFSSSLSLALPSFSNEIISCEEIVSHEYFSANINFSDNHFIFEKNQPISNPIISQETPPCEIFSDPLMFDSFSNFVFPIEVEPVHFEDPFAAQLQQSKLPLEGVADLDSHFQLHFQQRNQSNSEGVPGHNLSACSPQRELRELLVHFSFFYPFS